MAEPDESFSFPQFRAMMAKDLERLRQFELGLGKRSCQRRCGLQQRLGTVERIGRGKLEGFAVVQLCLRDVQGHRSVAGEDAEAPRGLDEVARVRPHGAA